MPFNDYFIFDGKNSLDYGLYMASDPQAVHPARRGETFPIPGRNGVIVREDGSYDTYTQSYDVFFDSNTHASDIYGLARKVASWLLGSRGFCRLEDSYEPDVFHLARCANQLSVENRLTRFGRAQISFECQPQRYLKVGETEISIKSYVLNGFYDGEIELHSIPHGSSALFVKLLAGTVAYVGRYRDENGDVVGQQIYDTPVTVPDGAKSVTVTWNNATAESVIEIGMVDISGNEISLCGVSGVTPTVFNFTDHESRPLLKFVDTSTEPPIVEQTIETLDEAYIGKDGDVYQAQGTKIGAGYAVCNEISVTGYSYAYVSGNSYAFYDSNHNVLSVVTDYYKIRRTYLKNTKVAIPAGAAIVVIGTKQSAPDMALSLQAARPNPGASAVTINGTTISLDFSERDTIYLDCDLHDAYYIDGSSANDKVTFTSNIVAYPTFPGFTPGDNTIAVRDGGNLDFSVIPRWWEL